MLGGMVKSSTQTAWWTILFRLLIMCVVLILICSSVILEVRPAAVMSSKLLRSSAPALASYNYSFGSPENMAYVRYHIVYDFVAVRFSDSDKSKTDADYIEVFGLCFVV